MENLMTNKNLTLVEMLGGYLKESMETIDTQINLQYQKVVSPFAPALCYWESPLNNNVTILIHEESLKELNQE